MQLTCLANVEIKTLDSSVFAIVLVVSSIVYPMMTCQQSSITYLFRSAESALSQDITGNFC